MHDLAGVRRVKSLLVTDTCTQDSYVMVNQSDGCLHADGKRYLPRKDTVVAEMIGAEDTVAALSYADGGQRFTMRDYDGGESVATLIYVDVEFDTDGLPVRADISNAEFDTSEVDDALMARQTMVTRLAEMVDDVVAHYEADDIPYAMAEHLSTERIGLCALESGVDVDELSQACLRNFKDMCLELNYVEAQVYPDEEHVADTAANIDDMLPDEDDVSYGEEANYVDYVTADDNVAYQSEREGYRDTRLGESVSGISVWDKVLALQVKMGTVDQWEVELS